MLKLAPLVSITTLLAVTTPSLAQRPHQLSTQVVLSLARRSWPSAGASTTEGLQLAARVGRALVPRLAVMAEVSVTRYGDETLALADLCSQGQVCLNQPGQVPGLVMAGLAAGLQPWVSLGPLELQLTTTIGGYWLIHRPTPVAAVAPAARATLGLRLPLGARARVLLEAGALHLTAPGARDGNTRHVGIGVSFN
jgi:hypothetical protein